MVGDQKCDIGFCFLRDQRPITVEAHRQARMLCAQIHTLIAGRAEFLRQSGRCPEIHLPHGNWELGAGLYSAYSTLASGTYDVVNKLRLFSQIFTGYQLLSVSRPVNAPIPKSIPADIDDRLAVLSRVPGPEVRVYRELAAYLPELLHTAAPNMFGEVGWLVNGKIVNHDTTAILERIALLAECGKLWELRNRRETGSVATSTMLEIGPGYGGLAHHLRTLIPQARYFLVDIPESLLFSSIYLATLWPDGENILITPENLAELKRTSPGFTFVPNYLFDDLLAARIRPDLVVNTLSMSEMTENQIGYYCRGIAKLLGDRGVFFEQNQDNRHLGLADARSIIAKHFRLCYPIKSHVLKPQQGTPHLWADVPVGPYAWTSASVALRPGLPPPPLRMQWWRKKAELAR